MYVKLQKLILILAVSLSFSCLLNCQDLPEELITPPGEYSVMPFWFWKDELKHEEIISFKSHEIKVFILKNN
jgi:hypothetical protein